ncbi:hypothetical protein NYO98_04770 [Nocardioides sp. STR2]|uniref:PH domain-containing protein n=1 Tax=Nocardioides pini TaxID=2975053 RepID=A0ABT4C9E5_9ACTN|nr:STM3941 family protein [Nocardioides pini]MCY4725583.1 hypothetical protein [Nocardioides pini]
MPTVIERSRAKGLASVLGCVVFVLASLAIIAQGSALTLVVGAVGVLTFGWFGIAWVVFLMRTGPGLVVDDMGFDDHSSASAVGRVSWADVLSVSERRISGTSLIIVEVREPGVCVARLGRLARVIAAVNRRTYGSPVVLSSVGLETSFASLSALMHEGVERYRLRGPRT